MAVGSVNYASPVQVNGYACKNCSDVDLAAKNIDPAHPRSGPLNRDAVQDPTRQDTDPVKIAAARKTAEAIQVQVVAYSPAGVRNAKVSPGAIFSLVA
ncbi:hypothetical protein [Sphingomonas sp. Ant20]|jgi:hypothetical protein|uniref:hypothetical protein n=1 Tax=Sphingomonas sp. Ant20 TaxID=104605 RepID=UPI00053751A4|nr:hypothetical protein [Sphingomonas sp. Ant20]KHA62643.1 hypothetical protein NI18_21270 [Sphingomonas sp. Ant20]